MFKISEFSQLSQISIKTLRYYDQLGLLKPAHSDPRTSYHYYTADQLLRLNRILAFKDLGFTLEQIVHLLDEHISSEFASLTLTATPEPVIANRVYELMQQWIADPKPQKAHWTEIKG